MEILTANEAKTNFGDMLLKAQRNPVQITRSGKPVAYIISCDDYLSYEKTKIEMFRRMVFQSERDIANGDLSDGEVFMQELIDGKYDT